MHGIGGSKKVVHGFQHSYMLQKGKWQLFLTNILHSCYYYFPSEGSTWQRRWSAHFRYCPGNIMASVMHFPQIVVLSDIPNCQDGDGKCMGIGSKLSLWQHQTFNHMHMKGSWTYWGCECKDTQCNHQYDSHQKENNCGDDITPIAPPDKEFEALPWRCEPQEWGGRAPEEYELLTQCAVVTTWRNMVVPCENAIAVNCKFDYFT